MVSSALASSSVDLLMFCASLRASSAISWGMVSNISRDVDCSSIILSFIFGFEFERDEVDWSILSTSESVGKSRGRLPSRDGDSTRN